MLTPPAKPFDAKDREIRSDVLGSAASSGFGDFRGPVPLEMLSAADRAACGSRARLGGDPAHFGPALHGTAGERARPRGEVW